VSQTTLGSWCGVPNQMNWVLSVPTMYHNVQCTMYNNKQLCTTMYQPFDADDALQPAVCGVYDMHHMCADSPDQCQLHNFVILKWGGF